MSGSSPLTRGKRIRLASTRSHFRLIPAHAGKTSAILCGALARAAHPRSRGENVMSPDKEGVTVGSSPLTRGKPDALPHAGGCERLIPAHAGKTGPQADRPDRRLIPAHAGKTKNDNHVRRPHPAHPRSRGENTGCPQTTHGSPGSSPLTRGKPDAIRQDRHHHRLIPAHAGKTPPPATKRPPSTAHPRSRGEN